jgi:hypothetical protein
MSDDRISIRISRSQKEKLRELGGGSITQGFEIVMSWLDSAPSALPPHPGEKEMSASKEAIMTLEKRIEMLEEDEFWMSGADSKAKISMLRKELDRKKSGLQSFEFDELSKLIQNL